MLHEFENKYLEFNMKVCNLEGVDEELLNEILGLMEEIKIKYSKADCIPKPLAGLFIDISESLVAYSDYYKHEAEKQNVIESADMLAEKAREICFD